MNVAAQKPRLGLPMPFQHMSPRLAKKATESGQKVKFVNPNTDNYENNIRSCAARNLPMPQKNSFPPHTTAVVCGSGPSLKDPIVVARIREVYEQGAVLFACKAAIKFLHGQGMTPRYGVSMDPGAHIADPRKIFKAPGVTHIIASTSDPELFDYLLGPEHGDPADVWAFHSACGFNKKITADEYEQADDTVKLCYVRMESGEYYTDEQTMYAALFPSADVMGGGFNVVNRTVSLARYMGAEKIILAGADSGWRDNDQMYVDGPAHRPGVDMNDGGKVDGKNWNTRPDMLASAVSLARVAQKDGDKFEILGDTLPASLRKRDDAFLTECASF